jgi:hypothetical protein
MTLSTALNNLNAHIESADQQNANEDDSTPQKKELMRVVDAAGNHYKIVTAPITRHLPFHPPPVPTPLSQEQLDALDREASAAEEAGEGDLSAQLEAQVPSQDAEMAAAMGRRDRAKIEAFLNPAKGSAQTAEIVFNTTMRNLRERFSFFTPTEPAPLQEPKEGVEMGQRRRRGFAVQVPGKRRIVIHAISVKRQRRLKMKKHKYKKVSLRQWCGLYGWTLTVA